MVLDHTSRPKSPKCVSDCRQFLWGMYFISSSTKTVIRPSVTENGNISYIYVLGELLNALKMCKCTNWFLLPFTWRKVDKHTSRAVYRCQARRLRTVVQGHKAHGAGTLDLWINKPCIPLVHEILTEKFYTNCVAIELNDGVNKLKILQR